MFNKRFFSSALIFFVVIAAAVCAWLLFAAPIFQEKEQLVRSENAVMSKDIAEAEAMNNNTAELEENILAAKEKIAEYYRGRDYKTDTAISQIIIKTCEECDVAYIGSAVSGETPISPGGNIAPALWTAEVSFVFEGTEEEGAAVIRALENTDALDLEITSFIYRSAPPEEEITETDNDEESENTKQNTEFNKKEWTVFAQIYFYERKK